MKKKGYATAHWIYEFRLFKKARHDIPIAY